MKNTLFGVGLIIAGCIGVALGNLEETIYYTSQIGAAEHNFHQGAAYYMFWAYILIGFAAIIADELKTKKKKG